jgi:hypothetical protein
VEKKRDESEVEAKHQRAWRGEHGEGASFLLPEGLGAGRDDPQVILCTLVLFFSSFDLALYMYVILLKRLHYQVKSIQAI